MRFVGGVGLPIYLVKLRANQLAPDAEACDRCGAVFTPDAQAVKEQAKADMWESRAEATEGEAEALDKLRALSDEHPELVAELK